MGHARVRAADAERDGTFTFITEQIPGLTVSGPGIGARQERELSGRKYWVMPGEPIAPGGMLAFTMNGLPATDTTGRTWPAVLALLLVGGAIVFGRRPKGRRGRPWTTADERDAAGRPARGDVRRAGRAGAQGARAGAARARRSAQGAGRRARAIYRELAALDERRAA